jgi:membrane-bound ClpP family serine protease
MIKEYFKTTSEGAIRVKEKVKIIVKEKQVLIVSKKYSTPFLVFNQNFRHHSA